MSRSPVARGSLWKDTAYAPTTRNLAPASDNARNRSRKSGFTGIPAFQPPDLFAQPPGFGEPFVRRDPLPELVVRLVLGRSPHDLAERDVAPHVVSVYQRRSCQ